MPVLVLMQVLPPQAPLPIQAPAQGTARTTHTGTKRYSLDRGRGGRALWRVLGLIILVLGMVMGTLTVRNRMIGVGMGARPTSASNMGLETQDKLQEVLNMCRKDMVALWHDQDVRDVLRRRKISLRSRVREFPFFLLGGNVFIMPSLLLSSFLDDLERLSSLKYMPTDCTSSFSLSFSPLQRS